MDKPKVKREKKKTGKPGKKKAPEDEDLSRVIEVFESSVPDSLPKDDVAEAINEVQKEADHKIGYSSPDNEDYSGIDYGTDLHNHFDTDADIVPVPPDEVIEEDFSVHRLRKATDPKEYLSGKKYLITHESEFMVYLRESVQRNLKRANILTKKGLKSASSAIHSFYDSLVWVFYDRKH